MKSVYSLEIGQSIQSDVQSNRVYGYRCWWLEKCRGGSLWEVCLIASVFTHRHKVISCECRAREWSFEEKDHETAAWKSELLNGPRDRIRVML